VGLRSDVGAVGRDVRVRGIMNLRSGGFNGTGGLNLRARGLLGMEV
jgi:hypothetical protein